MGDLVCQSPSLPAMADGDIEKVRQLESELRRLPQVNIVTTHHFHAGMYARTICVPKGVIVTGVLIKVPTLLIVSGEATVFIGGESVFVSGYHVIPGGAHRKQAVLAHEDTHFTMLFPSEADSVEAAELEFTDEPELLFSRQAQDDVVVITGERLCQAEAQRLN